MLFRPWSAPGVPLPTGSDAYVGALASGLLLAAARGAYARTEITRLFSWPEKTEANIKAHGQRAATVKKVSTKE